MNDLIIIKQKIIGNANVNSVNSRELWENLEIKKDFSSWIKRQIESLGLEENIDYIFAPPKRGAKKGSGGHNQKDYIITVDTAKHISMASCTAKGKEIRKYFIEAEKQFKKVDTNMGLIPVLHKMLAQQEKQTNIMIGLLDNMQTQISSISTKLDNVAVEPILYTKSIPIQEKYNHNLKFVSKQDEIDYQEYLNEINCKKRNYIYSENDFRQLNLPNKHHNTLYALYKIQQTKQSNIIDNKEFYLLTTSDVVEYLDIAQSTQYTYIVLCKLSERDIIQKVVLSHSKIYFRISDKTINKLKQNKDT